MKFSKTFSELGSRDAREVCGLAPERRTRDLSINQFSLFEGLTEKTTLTSGTASLRDVPQALVPLPGQEFYLLDLEQGGWAFYRRSPRRRELMVLPIAATHLRRTARRIHPGILDFHARLRSRRPPVASPECPAQA